MSSEAVTFGLFESFFRPQVRSWLGWETLAKEVQSVVVHLAVGRHELGQLSSIWYVDSHDRFSDWRVQNARRLSVREAAERGDAPSPDSAHRIADIRLKLEASTDGPMLVLPIIESGSERIIVDGNHRGVAAFREEVPIRLILVVARCQPNPMILPDFLHARDSEFSPEGWAEQCQILDDHFQGRM